MEVGRDYIGVTVCFMCNDGKGNFLLHKRSNAARDERGRWDFGGGKLEMGEELEGAVLREVKEEYGVDGEIQEELPAFSIIREEDGRRTQWIAIPFFVKVDVSKARIMEPEKVTEMGIFRLDKMPSPMHSAWPRAMAMYKRHFERYGR